MTILVEKVEDYVKRKLKDLPKNMYFHNIKHTEMVVKAAKEVCCKVEASEEVEGVVLIAAWFHDIGYLCDYYNHEEESKIIALDFLIKENYDVRKINEVLNCINATRFGYEPKSLAEKIIRDADVYHLASNQYFDWLARLRSEWEHKLNTCLTDQQWYYKNLLFLKNHSFCTAYGQRVLEKKKQLNINKNIKKMEGRN
ncbi:HD domain-containing protein [Fulvivirga ligni]|uniref:HD domain-containing protein n=1 Tax=Fulvivirga ligni TaxID=2904246 RepID=UPI001F2748EC|nr:HD domain-containing protein [Fulvivirga ligni]UII22351.1 HD domain-containing protein [Fulvivirga ligni]